MAQTPAVPDKRLQALVVGPSLALRAPVQNALRPSFEAWGASSPAEAREFLQDQGGAGLPALVALRCATLAEGLPAAAALQPLGSNPCPVLLVLDEPPDPHAAAALPDHVDAAGVGAPGLHRHACLLARLAAAERALRERPLPVPVAPLPPILPIAPLPPIAPIPPAADPEAARRFEELARYVPAPVVDAVRDGMTLSMQREPVTAAFVALRGFTDAMEFGDTGAAVAALSAFMDECHALVAAHGGTVGRFMVDGFLACFGGLANPGGSPESAVRCALALRDRLEALRQEWFERGMLPVGCSVGLCTGRVVLASLGSEPRDFAVLGGPVHRALRLATSAASGEVLAEDSTWQHAQSAAAAEGERTVDLAGMAEPIHAIVVGPGG